MSDRTPEWTLGDKLRKAREQAGFSQNHLAELLHVSRVTVLNAERGHHEPHPSTVKQWAKMCQVAPEWIAND